MLADRPADLVASTTRFCRALRDAGLSVTPSEAIEAVRALELVDLADRDEVRQSLRSILTARPEEFATFDDAFDTFWSGVDAVVGSSTPRGLPGLNRPRSHPTFARWMRPGSNDIDEGEIAIARQSAVEQLQMKDFASFTDAELGEVRRVAAQLARRLAARAGRRWRSAARGPRLDPRQLLRRSLKTGGDILELAYRERRPRKTKLVVLCDVSGSMDLYARFLLQFLYSLQNCFARVETFVFSTRLHRVTDELRRRPYGAALRRLSLGVEGWSGGTRIGESIAAFVAAWPRLVDRRTVVVIVSDGWDAGEPDVLASTLATIHERAGRVVWLNPLLGSPTYRPETRGMVAALPHLDVFAPLHNLASLRALARHLVL